MESRKRKLPARASARVEAVSKKRTSTPPREPSRAPTPVVQEDPLPKTLLPGRPLPTVDKQQDDDLSLSEYQSIAERYAYPLYFRGNPALMFATAK